MVRWARILIWCPDEIPALGLKRFNHVISANSVAAIQAICDIKQDALYDVCRLPRTNHWILAIELDAAAPTSFVCGLRSGSKNYPSITLRDSVADCRTQPVDCGSGRYCALALGILPSKTKMLANLPYCAVAGGHI